MNVSGLILGSVLPESILAARWFAVLSTFVAINTMLYVSMSIFKILPKPYFSDVVRRDGRRAETRSIYPEGHSIPDEGQLREPTAPTGQSVELERKPDDSLGWIAHSRAR